MNLKQYKVICIIFFVICMFTILHTNSYAATMQMSISKTSAYVGETFTVTISGINGRVNISGNSNISIDKSGSQWVDGSLTITGTTVAVGEGTITVTPVDVTTTAAEPEEVTASASRSITINEKEQPTTPSTPEDNETPTTPAEPEQPTKPTEPSKPSTPSNSTTDANNKPVEEDEEEKETEKEDNFYITTITLKGVKENGEQVDIALSPEFNKDTYEYTCNITSDIQKIDLQKDAGEYTNSIIVTGLEELKEGENIIKLQLSAEDHETKVYTIKVMKEEKIIETVAEVEEQTKIKKEEDKTKMVSMPLWIFIIMQVVIIIIEVLIIYFVPWRQFFNR